MNFLRTLKNLKPKSNSSKPKVKSNKTLPGSKMEITYQAPTTVEKTITVDEKDLPDLYAAIRDCFLHRVQTFGLSDPYLPFEHTVVDFLNKVGIDHKKRIEVVAFFDGLLKGSALPIGAANDTETTDSAVTDLDPK